MEVVSEGPGGEFLTRDALVQMFREFRQEMVVLLKDSYGTTDSLLEDVTRVKGQLTGLRTDHDSLQQAFTELKSKVSDLRHPKSLPVTPEESSVRYVVKTDRCGDLVIHVQGDVSQQDKRAVFLTVHDLGCNHYSFEDFINKPCMSDIKERSIFIHVDVPGHEDNADPLPDSFQFPTLQALGEDLLAVLDFVNVKYVIGLGEGAGANVLARFGLAHPQRTLGLILINCTGSATTVKDNFKAKFVNWKGKGSVSQSAEDYLVFHKFGHQLMNENSPDKDKVMSDFLHKLRGTINHSNVRLYVNAFLNRKDLPLKQYKSDILLITGVLSSYANVVEKLFQDLDKNKATLLRIERAGDVLNESPAKVAHSILLFAKGQGLLTSVTLPGVERQRTFSGSSIDMDRPRRFSRGLSMEEYDKPNLRRLSITVGDVPVQTSK
uniref:AB hydrolase-1 domain-containing protein n=1 Tax=Graphocephala atropunctata TaxID=36148 RepID=A0A1B6L4H9_9HEMI